MSAAGRAVYSLFIELRDVARQHPIIYFVGAGLVTIVTLELYLAWLGAPPLGLIMGIVVGVPMYAAVLWVFGALSKDRDGSRD